MDISHHIQQQLIYIMAVNLTNVFNYPNANIVL